jgi:hypothetical protein
VDHDVRHHAVAAPGLRAQRPGSPLTTVPRGPAVAGPRGTGFPP